MSITWDAISGFVSGIFKPATDLIEDMHTSKEEELTLRNALVKIQSAVTLKQLELTGKMMDLERALIDAQASIINSEAKSESWIARNWRPITMLTFVGLIVLNSLGVIKVDPKIAGDFFDLVKIGLGGYVVGRSIEKAAKHIKK